MSFFQQSKCIWTTLFEPGEDTYRLFRKIFQWDGRGNATMEVCADSTYMIWINGKRCKIQQDSNYPERRTVSKLDVTPMLRQGDNIVAAEVHFINHDFFSYLPGTPFLRLAIYTEDALLTGTDETWKCAASQAYANGLCCQMTPQLGWAFCYDARKSLPWQAPFMKDDDWSNAQAYQEPLPWASFTARKVPQLTEVHLPQAHICNVGYIIRKDEGPVLGDPCQNDFMQAVQFDEIFSNTEGDGKPFYINDEVLGKKALFFDKLNGNDVRLKQKPGTDGFFVTIDLGAEKVGYLDLKVRATDGTIIDIAHGEHLNDGRVRCRIADRSFVDRYICYDGLNEFIYMHRRLGCRYLELHVTNKEAKDWAFSIHHATLLSTELPLPITAQFHSADRMTASINRISIDTLKLCMHEHYEDCPWREQGLYGYDSRNQMLYGYYVWGNYAFAENSINLLGESFDGKRYITLTAPAHYRLLIPIFTWAWVCAVREHVMYSGNLDVMRRWLPQINQIIDDALTEPEPEAKGLYSPGKEPNVWNFCEWTGKLDGWTDPPKTHQAPYNIYLYEVLHAARQLNELDGNLDRAEFLAGKAQALGERIKELFWNDELGCYSAFLDDTGEEAFEHVQAIMLANGLVPQEHFPRVFKALKEHKLRKVDLSAMIYFIGGLMDKGPEAQNFVLDTLRETFEPVALSGATSVWETRGDAPDFDGAVSLCHAWSSSMPYFCGRYILGVEPLEPGFRKFRVKPFAAGLDRASGTVPTPYGMIRVSWVKDGDGFKTTVACPRETLQVTD